MEDNTDATEVVQQETKAPRKKKVDQVTKVAQELLDGVWGPAGRDRDNRLRESGHDVEAVRKEYYRLRGQAAADNQTDLQRARSNQFKVE